MNVGELKKSMKDMSDECQVRVLTEYGFSGHAEVEEKMMMIDDYPQRVLVISLSDKLHDEEYVID